MRWGYLKDVSVHLDNTFMDQTIYGSLNEHFLNQTLMVDRIVESVVTDHLDIATRHLIAVNFARHPFAYIHASNTTTHAYTIE